MNQGQNSQLIRGNSLQQYDQYNINTKTNQKQPPQSYQQTASYPTNSQRTQHQYNVNQAVASQQLPLSRQDKSGQQHRAFKNVYEISQATDNLMNHYQRNLQSQRSDYSNISNRAYSSNSRMINPMNENKSIQPNQYSQYGPSPRNVTPLGLPSYQNPNQHYNFPVQNLKQPMDQQSIYAKPINQKYQELMMNDAHLGVHERNTALYTKFDMKNLDVKTDGSPVKYKPEYHKSQVQSDIFPLSNAPDVRVNMQQQRNAISPSQKQINMQPNYLIDQKGAVQQNEQSISSMKINRIRRAQENRRIAKQDILRKQRLKDVLSNEL